MHQIAGDPALFLNGERSVENLILKMRDICVAFILAMIFLRQAKSKT
jgi:hypothetical protein